MKNFKYRKIKINEINKAADIMANCFADYPLYLSIFSNAKKRNKQIKAFYKLSLFARRDYTYILDDFSFVGCIRYPNNKSKSLILSFLNPRCFFSCFCLLKIKNLRILRYISKTSEEARNKNYDQDKDIFVEALCINKTADVRLRLVDILEDYLDEGNYNIYCETCVENLRKLYESFGFEVVDKTKIFNLINYSMIKKVAKIN